MFNLNVKKYYATLAPRGKIELTPFNGSTFRGAFGYLLKRIVCIHTIEKLRKCEHCIINQSCQYTSIFETGVQNNRHTPDMVTNFAPHPFVFEPPLNLNHREYNTGDDIPFNIILIGEPKRLLPYFIYTFEKMGAIGIGPERGKFELKAVQVGKNENRKIIYTSATKYLSDQYPTDRLSIETSLSGNLKNLQIRLETPVRIKYRGHYIRELTFPALIKTALRRITTLAQNYGKWAISTDQIHDLLKKAEDIQTVIQETRWVDYRRFSTRQKQKMMLGGIVGRVGFTGDITPFFPFLKAAEALHIGKNTSFGLGKIHLQPETGD